MRLRYIGILFIGAAMVLPVEASPQCRVVYNGEMHFDWLLCNITSVKGVLTFEQGNHFTAEIKNGVLRSNIKHFDGPKNQSYNMDNFGSVTEKMIDGGVCYQTLKLEVCSSDSED